VSFPPSDETTGEGNGGLVPGTLAVDWIHGAPARHPSSDPPFQVHWYERDTAILRQSKLVHYEAPFLYLLFGARRALLLDTGAVGDPRRAPVQLVVEGLITEWLRGRPRADYELVVAHTHGHADHVSGDPQFVGRARTTLVGPRIEDVCQAFAISHWPDEIISYDLGGRVVEVTGCPGHHRSSIALYDHRTGLLLTGDTVYPGRLYVEDPDAFSASLERLSALAHARPVRHVLGCHIEMSARPGVDYPIGSTYQPDEAPLPLSVADLDAVRDAARAAHGRPGVYRYEKFALWIGPCRGPAFRSVSRGLLTRIREAALGR